MFYSQIGILYENLLEQYRYVSVSRDWLKINRENSVFRRYENHNASVPSFRFAFPTPDTV